MKYKSKILGFAHIKTRKILIKYLSLMFCRDTVASAEVPCRTKVYSGISEERALRRGRSTFTGALAGGCTQRLVHPWD